MLLQANFRLFFLICYLFETVRSVPTRQVTNFTLKRKIKPLTCCIQTQSSLGEKDSEPRPACSGPCSQRIQTTKKEINLVVVFTHTHATGTRENAERTLGGGQGPQIFPANVYWQGWWGQCLTCREGSCHSFPRLGQGCRGEAFIFRQSCGSASLYADPDPYFSFNAGSDPAPYQSDVNLRPLVHRPSRAPI